MDKNGDVSSATLKKREEMADQAIEQIIREKHKLNAEEHPISLRLLDEELKNTQQTGRAAYDDRFIDVYNDKPIKAHCRVLFPSKAVPTFNFVGKLLGPKGLTLKHLQEETQCKMFILGKGSMRDPKKEEEAKASGDPKYAHLSEQIHVDVSCIAPPSEAYERLAFALNRLKMILVPDPPNEPLFLPYGGEEEEEWHGAGRGGRGGRGGGRGRGGRGGGRMPPLIDNQTKVMGYLEKARNSMDFQPPVRRYGPPARASYGGDQPFHRREPIYDAEMYGGPERGGGGYYPRRSAPYARY